MKSGNKKLINLATVCCLMVSGIALYGMESFYERRVEVPSYRRLRLTRTHSAENRFSEWLTKNENLKTIPIPTADHGYKGNVYCNLFVQDSDGQGYFVSMVGNENTIEDVINRFNEKLRTSGDNIFIKLVTLETGTRLRNEAKVGAYKRGGILRDNQVLRIYRKRDLSRDK